MTTLVFVLVLFGVAFAQDYDEVRSQNKWWSDYANLYDYDDAELDKMMNLIITKNILPGDAPLPLDERLFFRNPGSSEEVDFVPVAAPPPPRRKSSSPRPTPNNRRPVPTTTPAPLPSSSPRPEPPRSRLFANTRRPLLRPVVTQPPPTTPEADDESDSDSAEEHEDSSSDFNSRPEVRPHPVSDLRPEQLQASVLSDSQNVFVTRGTEAPKLNQSPNRLPFLPEGPVVDSRPRPSSFRPEVLVTSPIPPPVASNPPRDEASPIEKASIPPRFFASTPPPFPRQSSSAGLSAPGTSPGLSSVVPRRFSPLDFHSAPVTSDFTRGPLSATSLPPQPFPPNSFQPPIPPQPAAPPNGNGNGNGRRTQVLKRRLRPSSTAGPLEEIEEAPQPAVHQRIPPQSTHDVSRVRNQIPRQQASSEVPMKSTKKPLGNGGPPPSRSSPASFNPANGFPPNRVFTPPPHLQTSSVRGGPAQGNRSIPPQQGSSFPSSQLPQQFHRGTSPRPFPESNGGNQPHPFQATGARFQTPVSTVAPPPFQQGPQRTVRRRPVFVSSTNAPFDEVQPRSPEHEVRGRVSFAATTPVPSHAFVSQAPLRSSSLPDSNDNILISSNTEIIPPSALREAVPSRRQVVARGPARRVAASERTSTRFQRDDSRRRNAYLASASSSPVGMAARPDGSFVEFVPDIDDLNLLSKLSALSDNALPSTTLSPNDDTYFQHGQFIPESIKFIFGPVYSTNKNSTVTPPKGVENSSRSWTPPCVQNGRNFCLHTDFYPNALVERAVKEHTAEVSKLFNELRSFEKPSSLSTSNDDNDEEQQQRAQFVCESQAGVVRPGWAQDSATGKWLVVINTDEFSQVVRIETCTRQNEACLFIAPYYRSSCREHQSVQRLVSIDPESSSLSPQVALVQMPCGCSCMVGTGQTQPQTPIR